MRSRHHPEIGRRRRTKGTNLVRRLGSLFGACPGALLPYRRAEATTRPEDRERHQLSASDGTLTITSTYDRLNRVLTVDDEDAGTAADTSYTYSLTAPSWTDPNGTYLVTLDRFDRLTSVDDPVSATAFAWTYRADGQPAAFGQPNGNTTTYGYDPLGREMRVAMRKSPLVATEKSPPLV